MMAYDHVASLIAGDDWPEQPKPRKRPAEFLVDGVKLETTVVFDAYWYFAAERQRIFFRRLRRSNRPDLSDDAVFRTYKFTNSYRASDRVSQYLIRNVIYPAGVAHSNEDTFFRILLFKLFNKIETWQALESEFGDLDLRTYDFARFDEYLTDRLSSGERIYAAAYIMPSAGRVFGHSRKHTNHLALVEWMLEQKFPQRLTDLEAMSDGFDLLLSAPSLGRFLAYQFITDINYSSLTEFSEMEFVVPGPGALDGISKCFVDTRGVCPSAIIRAVAQQQHQMFAQRRIQFPSLWGRELQLIDCQNLFCEISKYSRVAYPDVAGVAGRSRIKQKFKPSGSIVEPYYPPAWGLNKRIVDYADPLFDAGSAIASTQQLRLL